MTITFVRKSAVDNIVDKMDRPVSHQSVTKTSDFNGEETLTYSTATTINAVALRRKKEWNNDKAGRIEQGDAYIIIKPATATLKDNDKITFDSVTYYIKNPITRYADTTNSTAVYKYAELFIYDA